MEMASSTSPKLDSSEAIKVLCMELDALHAATASEENFDERRRLAAGLEDRQRELIRALLDGQRDGTVDMAAAVPLIGRLSSQREWGVES